MKLDSFLAVKSPPVNGERPAGAASGNAGGGPSSFPAPAQAPAITRDVTPSGIEVLYQSSPKRLYKVRQLQDGDEPWVEVPSVTTVLDVLNKGGLTVWGMRVGIQGVLTLFERGHLTTEIDWQDERERVAVSAGHLASPELVEGLMKIEGLTTDDVKGSAADRGDIVHKALDTWAKTGKIPNPDDFDEREKGYVEGVAKFLIDADPTPVRSEVLVGSVEHGYAGRYDLEIELSETKRVRKTPKQKWHDIGPGLFLLDCKSAKDVYKDTNYRQLAGYEGARVEGGYPPTDGQYVLNVNGEGSYALPRSTATLTDFLEVLAVYRGNRRLMKAA